MVRTSYLIFAVLSVLFCFFPSSSGDFVPDYDVDRFPLKQHQHERIRRFVQVVSRRHPEDKPQRGIGFSGHLKNLLKGGTVGLEFQIPHVDKFGKRRYWKDLFDSFDRGEEEENKKDYEMIERESRDYGHLINPRVKLREHDP